MPVSAWVPTTVVRSLAIRNFRLYFLGGVVSNIGVWMVRTGQSWVVLHLGGGSGAALGVVTFLQFAPTLVFSLWAGSLSDRYDKATILTVTQSLIGLAGLALALLDGLHLLSLAWVYVLAALVGIVTAFDAPVRQAFATELVGPDNVVNAVGLNTASFNVARLTGPLVAALIITSAGTWLVFLLNFITSGAIVSSLLRIDRSALFHRRAVSRGGWAAGFRCVAASPLLITFIALASLGNATGANSMQVVIPMVATDTFRGSALGFGFLTAALAVGGLSGALITSAQSGLPRVRWIVVAVTCFGLSQITASLMPSMITFALLLVLVGVCFMSFVVMVNTSVQMTAPPELRGRVVAVYMMFFMGGGALGSPVLGVVADALGPMRAITAAGLSVLVAGILAAVLLRHRAIPEPVVEPVLEPEAELVDSLAEPTTTPGPPSAVLVVPVPTSPEQRFAPSLNWNETTNRTATTSCLETEGGA